MTKIYDSSLGEVTVNSDGSWTISNLNHPGTRHISVYDQELLAELFNRTVCETCRGVREGEELVCIACHERLCEQAVGNMALAIERGIRDYDSVRSYETDGMTYLETEYFEGDDTLGHECFLEALGEMGIEVPEGVASWDALSYAP